MKDPRPVMRGTIAWALGEIGSELCYKAIQDALLIEEDVDVRFELTKAMK